MTRVRSLFDVISRIPRGLPHEVYDALQIGQTHIEEACREVVG